ncbi:hypothetical protein [Burkholderia sp. Ax-1719]|uniref:hypothetical protein n=1 Tax=Burkholderia sp. Ax-1719 TaxID=2608334 RepID=UPI00142279A5|nr:hypothetical protein [Burkholderia sp. Ax-1719]NIE63159.1 hypothetical protein [Burkholderia sp. Ax-1719]
MLLRAFKFVFYVCIFASLLLVRVWVCPHPDSNPLGFFFVVGGVAALYMAYYIISEGHWAEVVASIIISLLLDTIAAIFPILAILVIIWFVFNIAVAISSIRQLIPMALASVVLYVLLFPDDVFRALGLQGLIGLPILVAYAVVGLVCAMRFSGDPLKFGLFRLSTMLISIPLIALLVASIQSGLRNLFERTFTSTARTVKVPQSVRAHIRAGSEVSAYTRNVSKTISEISVSTKITSGGAGLAGGVSTGRVILGANSEE